MAVATVSTKYQIVIPREVRQRLKIKPGDQFAFDLAGDVLRMVPVRPIRELRGFLKGVKNDFTREADREF
ncbi:MAG: AbrB/MazE/SpoVT family DNA-binding domain-containing protein [Bryobacteraceae bacterium]